MLITINRVIRMETECSFTASSANFPEHEDNVLAKIGKFILSRDMPKILIFFNYLNKMNTLLNKKNRQQSFFFFLEIPGMYDITIKKISFFTNKIMIFSLLDFSFWRSYEGWNVFFSSVPSSVCENFFWEIVH